MVPYHRERFNQIGFRPRRTRLQYHTLPRSGQGRVRYQVNGKLEGFRTLSETSRAVLDRLWNQALPSTSNSLMAAVQMAANKQGEL